MKIVGRDLISPERNSISFYKTHRFKFRHRQSNGQVFRRKGLTFPFISLYHSTKWAVEGFSESLSYELDQLGIDVKIIEPGGVDTDFNGRSMDFCLSEDLTEYSEPMGKFQANIANSGLTSSTAEFIAEGIYNAATDGKAQMRYLLGPDAEQTYAMREQVGDDAFIAGMKQQIFGESETSFSQN